MFSGGSTLCYLFSEQFGREYVMYYFGQKLTYLQQKIDDNSNRLLPFLLFARIFPISPSWLLNIVAPFLNIPLRIFVISAFIGKPFALFPCSINHVLIVLSTESSGISRFPAGASGSFSLDPNPFIRHALIRHFPLALMQIARLTTHQVLRISDPMSSALFLGLMRFMQVFAISDIFGGKSFLGKIAPNCTIMYSQ
ncbi:SNARE-like domain protein [Oesophagostomum dentatum]|uniref:SNARE-like domain protein n=1 Tax=Oesophagostomum dentatum TaxID=61180 RepID=A0A0B1SDG7_OESDE|nr:SNARE-like domain protein [Oesophagostomum dentatum]